jgi:hypothetical protein
VAARTAELEAANARLTELALEREMLMMEVNHRAKNSLTIAASLLAMQRRRQTDPLVTAPLKETEDRIHALARVHDLLSKSESAQRVNVATYIIDLCEALTSLMEDDGRIRLEARVQDGILVDADTAVPLGMVLTGTRDQRREIRLPRAAHGRHHRPRAPPRVRAASSWSSRTTASGASSSAKARWASAWSARWSSRSRARSTSAATRA